MAKRAVDAPTRVFVRDDDVGDWTPELGRFVDVFLARGIPVAYAVIPDRLTAPAVDHLGRLADSHPRLITLHQHGLRHEQVIDGQQRWSEFDGHRPREDQLADITEGRRILHDALGDRLDASTFTPPAHKYDEATVDAMDELGFEVLSASIYHDRKARAYYLAGRLLRRVHWLGKNVSYHGGTIPGSRITELSMSLDVDQDGRGGRIDKSVERLAREFDDIRRHTPVVGLMTHHEARSEPERLATLAAFIDRLRDDSTVSFTALDACRPGATT